jgi:hypothetical protein
MLTPSDTAIRLYEVDFVLTGTGTPAAACMVFANRVGTGTTTASPATVYLTVFYDSTLPVGFGQWASGEGILFPDGVFIQTATAMSYYTIAYSAEYSRK